jgi:filamentous hemagglutinin family protein
MARLWQHLLSISTLFTSSFLINLNTDALAQSITLDGSLGTPETLTGPNYLIPQTAGQAVGNNLFHSFGKFNLNTNEAAIFQSNPNIQNILSRVTGGTQSLIDGLIRTQTGVNLFFINPSGIIFGQNAWLDVGGSFVASTANAIQFGNLGLFSATEKNVPSPLLTINPSALFFNQINQNAAIQNNSVAPAGIDLSGISRLGLRVPDGKSLLLVGGNVSMDGGQLNAYGGRVELGGLAAPGNVNLLFNDDNLSLKFPENVARASVLLTNQAFVFVAGAGGGNIAVNARNVEISGGSFLSAGIGRGLGMRETVAGDITLNATGEIKIADFASVFNNVRPGAKGSGGNIIVDAGDFSLRDGAQLVASTYGQGNAGNVIVNAKNTIFLAGEETAIFSAVEAGGIGKGGNIDINATTLSFTDSAQLITTTRGAFDTQPAGRGDAGNVNVKVSGAVDIAGEKNGFASGIGSGVETGTVGHGGNITIEAGSFSLRDGAQLIASTFGQGNAGNVTVRAKDGAVSLASGAAIISAVEAGGVGNGGNIDINAATLSLTDVSQLLTFTRQAEGTKPAGQGNAGNVNIKVSGAVDIAGWKNGLPSGILSYVDTGTVGDGGNITIDSASLSLRDGAQLSALTLGQGKAGNVTVRAKDAVSLAGNGAILTTVEVGGVGKGGNIDINAATLSLTDGGQLQTATRKASGNQPAGRGDAGNINIKVTGAVDIAGEKNGFGSGIISRVETGTVGHGGNITIDADGISLLDGAQLVASTSGQGNAGNISINAKDAVTVSGINQESGFSSALFTRTNSTSAGIGGDITVNTNSFRISDGALLDARTRNNQKGGNITVNANVFEALNGGQLTTTTESNGRAGKITVNATDKVIISGIDSNYDDRIAKFPDDVVDISNNECRDAKFRVSTRFSGNAELISGDV